MKKIWPLIFVLMLIFLIRSSYASVIYYYEEDPDPYAEQSDNGSVVEYQQDNDNTQWVETSVAASDEKENISESVSTHDNMHASVFYSRLPPYIHQGEKVIIVNPHRHVWGAYSRAGMLIHAGLATSGSTWCSDLGRSCRTKVGTFRIGSLGARNCTSSRYPLGKGGALMPYCMYFNGNQGIHGSYAVSEGNHSHGCVRISVKDAEWLRFHFASIGTKVIIMKY